MEPIHRFSFMPQMPEEHLKPHRKFGRYLHISLYIAAAFFFGIGCMEGMISVGTKTLGFVQNQTLVYSREAPQAIDLIAETEGMGSDDKEIVLPVNEYNVVGKPSAMHGDAYLVGDLETGEIIIQENIDTIFPIASVSKLVTALVARDELPAKTEVVVSKTALATYGPSGGLFSGEKVRAGDLLYPLLLESSNDVAQLIAEQFEANEFQRLMNKKVLELGMNNSSFEEASGLSKNNLSTAKDLFMLARYIYKEAPEILDVTRIKQYALLKHTWVNHNYMLRFDTFVGGKNGYTDEALRTTVSLFELPIKRGEVTEIRPVVIVVLHTDTREQDVVRLLDFVKKSVTLGK
jgi:D-alanyl-D-alanine carboxypeptidase